MATGGSYEPSDEDSDLLDHSEINKELAELSASSDSETAEDSLEWEEHKAQKEFESLSNASEELDFPGFGSQEENHSAKVEVEPKLTKSAPTSPTAHHSKKESKIPITASIREKIKSFEDLAKPQSQQTNSPQAVKCKTRQSVIKGASSPPESIEKQIEKQAKKSKPKKISRSKIVTMAQADIPLAGRLNPRTRAAGGVGDTLGSLGFPTISPENIVTACRNTVRGFLLIRAEIVLNANLVLTDANLKMGQSAALGHLEEIVDCRDRMDKALENVEDIDGDTDAAITEVYKVERELKNLVKYCEMKTVNGAVPAAPAVDQVKLARLDFPTFDGSGNYRTWKTNFTTLANYVNEDNTKKGHLLKSLQEKAKRYIESTMVPTSTFNDIMEMLESRYNDPMAVNYHLLNRVFNSPELNIPQSTQAHWDSAVGDIKAILDSGMGVGELLVFYRLHKFQNDIVRRIKDLHKIKYPGKTSISLEEAMDLMNKIIAEEAELTQDNVCGTVYTEPHTNCHT